MQTSTITVSCASRHRRPWLICLDLQREYVVPGRPPYDDGAAEVVDGLLPLVEVPLDPQAAKRNAAPAAAATVCHQEGPFAVTRLMLTGSSPVGCRASPARGYLAR